MKIKGATKLELLAFSKLKSLFIYLCFLSLLQTTKLQGQNFEWAKSFGAFTEDFASEITTDTLGNIYVAGHYDEDVDVDPGPGETMIYAVDGYDLFVLKFSPVGELIWVKTFATLGYQDINDMVVDSEERLLVSAMFTETIDVDPGLEEIMLTGGESYYTQVFLCLDLNGELLWYFADSEYGAVATNINFDKDENIYLAGSLSNTLDVDPGPGVFILSASSDACIRKFDPNGNFLWAKKFGDDDIGNIVDIAIDDANNLYFTGSFTGTLDFDPGPLANERTSVGNYDSFITKWDESGNMIWYTAIGGTEDDYTRVIELGNDGNLYLAGRFEGSCDFDGGIGTAIGVSAGNSDAFVCKYDNDGNYVWSWNFGDIGYELWNMFEMDSLDNLYVGGNFFGAIDLDPGPGELITDAGEDYGGYIVKMNKDKSLVWQMSINTGRHASVVNLCLDKNYNVIYTGQFSGDADFDPGPDEYLLSYYGGYPNYWTDIYFAKINQDPCANFTLVTDSVADVSCIMNGYASVHAINGSAPFNYSWNVVPAVTDSVITFAESGIFTVTATDNQTCERTTTYYIDGPGTIYTDWQTSIVTEDFRYGFESYIWLDTYNNGCEMSDGILQLVLAPEFNYIEAFPAPDYITGDTLQWVLSDFVYEVSHFSPTVLIQNLGAFVGSNVCLDLSVISGAIDVNPENDHWLYCSTVIGAIDPNDKAVYPTGSCDAGYILNEQPLTYTVRFQNTGTASAVNIEIIDSISSHLDINGIDIISTSHYMYTTLDGDSVAHFIFPDIYLADSTTDEPASHGYVVYTIKPKPGLDNNTLITNNAGIYFDFNEPVITNTVSNTIVDSIPIFSITQDVAICEGDSVVVGNSTYFTPGSYTNVLTSIDGCDSIIHTTIAYFLVDVTLEVAGNTLVVLQEDATYQWLDCNNDNSPIEGATSQQFEPGESGNYAAVIYKNGCADTTECVSFTYNVLADYNRYNQINIYPVPANDALTIKSGSAILNYQIVSMDGKMVLTGAGNLLFEQNIMIENLIPSFYFIEIKTLQGTGFLPFIKQ